MPIKPRRCPLSPQSRIRKQVLSLEEIQQRLRHKMPELAKVYRVKYLGIFGFYVRGEARKTSDLDLLVDFEEAPTLVEYIRMERLLSEELGIKVDLVMKKTLKPISESESWTRWCRYEG
jgi:uncharacterized protein